MDHPDDARVVRTRVLVPGSVKRYHLGSGYLVADEMVLTARHVLTPDGKAHSEPAGRCEVKRYGTEEWVRAEVGPS